MKNAVALFRQVARGKNVKDTVRGIFITGRLRISAWQTK